MCLDDDEFLFPAVGDNLPDALNPYNDYAASPYAGSSLVPIATASAPTAYDSQL